MSGYTNYTEPTSGLVLNLPSSWQVRFGPNEYLALLARPHEAELLGTNIVATTEQPPPEFRDIDTYTSHQLEAITQLRAGQNLCVLGRRKYPAERGDTVLAVHSFLQNKTLLANFQIFALAEDIGTVVTVTVPLAFLDAGMAIGQHLIDTFTPATGLYHHSFYQFYQK